MSLRQSLPMRMIVAFFLVGVIPLLVIGLAALHSTRSLLLRGMFSRLDSVAAGRQATMQQFFDQCQRDVQMLADGVEALHRDQKASVQELLAKPGQLNRAFFDRFLERSLYRGLFLTDPSGEGSSIAVGNVGVPGNVLTGSNEDAGLAKAVRAVLADNKQPAFVDFQFCKLVDSEPAAFLAGPVLDDAGEVKGVVTLVLSVGPLNAIMARGASLGDTGKCYLVGPDRLLRSGEGMADSLRDKLTVGARSVEPALAGAQGSAMVTGNGKTAVLSSCVPLDVFGTPWAVVAEINAAEASLPARHFTLLLATMMCMASLLSVMVAVLFARTLKVALEQPAPQSHERQDGPMF